MQRIARASIPLCGFVATAVLVVAPVAHAQEEVPEINAVVGLPYSGVGTQENVRVTSDGNRFIHKITTYYYRDAQGRTRFERDIPVQVSVTKSATQRAIVTINNKVTGEIDTLLPEAKIATVMQRPGMRVVDTPATLPEIFTHFGGMRIGSQEPGWSAPVSLGEKSIEGIHAVGTQRTYTIAAGAMGNEKTVTATVEQWASPDLGVILSKTVNFSTGAEVHYQLQQISQAEPNADLFTVPADYKKVVVPGKVASSGTASVTVATNQ